MNWTHHSGQAAKAQSATAPATTRGKTGPSTGTRTGPGPASSVSADGSARVSNGMREFLWLIGDIERGRVLDLGQVSQSTINFFIERGYRVSSEDLLRAWKEFLTTEEERLRQKPVGEDARTSQAMLVEKFLDSSLNYPENSYCGVLAWDLFDYLDAELLPRAMERIYRMLVPGGAVLAMFHSRPPERFHRYRIVDNQTIETLPAPTISMHARVFQNREILDIFDEFRTSKTFVGRDQVREALFLK
jgi:SAM-dependent methyltransferase